MLLAPAGSRLRGVVAAGTIHGARSRGHGTLVYLLGAGPRGTSKNQGGQLQVVPHRTRQLSQAQNGSSGCSLQVGSDLIDFQGCELLSAGTSFVDPADNYQVWWSLLPAANGGSGVTWAGGLKVNVKQLGGQWAG